MNDYQQAKDIVNDLKLNKQTLITISKIEIFRRYLSEVAKKADRKFITKIIGKDVLVIRIK